MPGHGAAGWRLPSVAGCPAGSRRDRGRGPSEWDAGASATRGRRADHGRRSPRSSQQGVGRRGMPGHRWIGVDRHRAAGGRRHDAGSPSMPVSRDRTWQPPTPPSPPSSRRSRSRGAGRPRRHTRDRNPQRGRDGLHRAVAGGCDRGRHLAHFRPLRSPRPSERIPASLRLWWQGSPSIRAWRCARSPSVLLSPRAGPAVALDKGPVRPQETALLAMDLATNALGSGPVRETKLG